jgi:hypothetical protein
MSLKYEYNTRMIGNKILVTNVAGIMKRWYIQNMPRQKRSNPYPVVKIVANSTCWCASKFWGHFLRRIVFSGVWLVVRAVRLILSALTRKVIFSRHHNSVVSYIHTITLLHVSVHQGPSSGRNPRKIQKSFLFTDMDPYWCTFVNNRCIDKISSCVFVCRCVGVVCMCSVCIKYV